MLEERIQIYKNFDLKIKEDSYVLYWMQQSHRVNYNHALEHAIHVANKESLPLVVYFGLTKKFPDANERHYAFMLEGLKEVAVELKKIGIMFLLIEKSPEKGIVDLLDKASAVILDKGYLNIQKKWRKEVIESLMDSDIGYVAEVDTDLIVPVNIASTKCEYAARTIRPKINKLFDYFSLKFKLPELEKKWATESSIEISDSVDLEEMDISDYLKNLEIDHSVKKSPIYRGGYSEALRLFDDFLENKLSHYKLNSPILDASSRMGMYLHFGQISSLELYHRMNDYLLENTTIDKESVEAFREQLVIRRELAFNYVYYNEDYDCFEGMTDSWAYETMDKHQNDIRPYLYSLDDLMAAKTHDKNWNKVMDEMVTTGYMNNYMRMYWGKKIIEWTPNFKIAYQYMSLLNNKYFLDGRDANSFAGVAWCFGKHDHGWGERDVFGKLRYMNAEGLKRKFKI